MALEPCPHCGRDFDHDNGGARSNHVESCAETAAKYQKSQEGAQEATRAAPAEPEGETAPQAVPSAATGHGAPPAPQGQATAQPPVPVDGQAVAQGLQVGQGIGEALTGSRGQQIQAAAGALAAIGQHLHEQDQASRERAKNAQGDVERAGDYPRCPECGGAIKGLPATGEEFDCPHCYEPLIAP